MGDVAGTGKTGGAGKKPGGGKRVKRGKGVKRTKPAKRGGRVVLVAAGRPVTNDELQITKGKAKPARRPQNAKRKRAKGKSSTVGRAASGGSGKKRRRSTSNTNAASKPDARAPRPAAFSDQRSAVSRKKRLRVTGDELRKQKPAPRTRNQSPVTSNPKPGGRVSTAETIDRELAAAALEKRRRGAKPTNQEIGALRRVERKREEERRWEIYGRIPQKDWREMSGRQAKVLNEQATRYGIPFGGRTVSLPDIVKRLHDFLAENKARLQADGATDALRTLKETVSRLRLEVQEKELKAESGKYMLTEEVDRDTDRLCGAFRIALGEQYARLLPFLSVKGQSVGKEVNKEIIDRHFGPPGDRGIDD